MINTKYDSMRHAAILSTTSFAVDSGLWHLPWTQSHEQASVFNLLGTTEMENIPFLVYKKEIAGVG